MVDKVLILIVDDSETQAFTLTFFLENQGYLVKSVKNGMSALEYLENNRPGLIISDILMPEMNGYELCKNIKSSDKLKDIPVILLTQLKDPIDIIRGLEAGADNFITKPYNEELLITRIKYLLINSDKSEDESEHSGIDLTFRGKKYFLKSERVQILNLLLSSYESAVDNYIALSKAENEIKRLSLKLLEKNQQINELSLTDNVTGLTNERAFTLIVNHDIYIASRRREKRLLLLLDIDNIKLINSTLGYTEGNNRRMDMAKILKETFRNSDIIARNSNDGFLVYFCENPSEYIDVMINRITDSLNRYNTINQLEYNLSISYGCAVYDPEHPHTVEQLIGIAYKNYKEKTGNREQSYG